MKETDMSASDIALIILILSAVGIGAYLLLRRRFVSFTPTSKKYDDLISRMVIEMIKEFESKALSYYLFDLSQRNAIEMEELREVFSEYGQFKEKPIFKATELADLGTQYYKIDNIISEYLAKANYKEHPDFLPIDRLELMIYRNKEENAKKILSKFM